MKHGSNKPPDDRPSAAQRLANARKRMDHALAHLPPRATHAVADMIHRVLDEHVVQHLDSVQPKQAPPPWGPLISPHEEPEEPPEVTPQGH